MREQPKDYTDGNKALLRYQTDIVQVNGKNIAAGIVKVGGDAARSVHPDLCKVLKPNDGADAIQHQHNFTGWSDQLQKDGSIFRTYAMHAYYRGILIPERALNLIGTLSGKGVELTVEQGFVVSQEMLPTYIEASINVATGDRERIDELERRILDQDDISAIQDLSFFEQGFDRYLPEILVNPNFTPVIGSFQREYQGMLSDPIALEDVSQDPRFRSLLEKYLSFREGILNVYNAIIESPEYQRLVEAQESGTPVQKKDSSFLQRSKRSATQFFRRQLGG